MLTGELADDMGETCQGRILEQWREWDVVCRERLALNRSREVPSVGRQCMGTDRGWLGGMVWKAMEILLSLDLFSW